MKLSQGVAAVLLLVAGAAAHAELSGTVGVVSDYDFRGISLSAKDPALQGSIDWAADSGFYAGAWASNIDYGDGYDGNIELDLYAGFAGETRVGSAGMSGWCGTCIRTRAAVRPATRFQITRSCMAPELQVVRVQAVVLE